MTKYYFRASNRNKVTIDNIDACQRPTGCYVSTIPLIASQYWFLLFQFQIISGISSLSYNLTFLIIVSWWHWLPMSHVNAIIHDINLSFYLTFLCHCNQVKSQNIQWVDSTNTSSDAWLLRAHFTPHVAQSI